MIVRMVEARVKPGRLADFRTMVMGALQRLQGVDGFLGFDVLRSHEDENLALVLVRWRDAGAIAAVLGDAWSTTLLSLPGEAEIVVGEPRLWHFVTIED